MSGELRQALERVARRSRSLRLWGGLALCWLAWSLAGAGLVALRSRPGHEVVSRGFLAVWISSLAATGLVCGALAYRSARDRRRVARAIEARHPELGTGLLAAVEEDAKAAPGGPGFLQAAVIRGALEHRRDHPWEESVVPPWALQGARVAHAAALALLVVVTVALADRVRPASGAPGASSAWAGASEVHVDPGDAEVERGTSLLVVARFLGMVPAEARLLVEGETPAPPPRAMSRSLEDPTFVGRVETVDADLSYRVEFEGRRTRAYRVRVFEYPELLRADARLVFPGYTALEPKTVEDIRHVTALEGTELTLLCGLNKDVASARLVDPEGHAIALAPDESVPHRYRATFTPDDSRRYRVQLVDREGRANKVAAEIVVNVTRNRPPAIVMAQPGRDVRVSPLEELRLKAEIDDDFGLLRHGLSYTLAGRGAREIVAEGPRPLARHVRAEDLIDFEALKARPDELVTFFYWAEDVGPDGRPRRTEGDLCFAEVRPFEEIFRQGEAPPGGSSEDEGQEDGARAAEKLAGLQKEIINGTWTLLRREAGPKPSPRFIDDARVLLESQRAALKQAEAASPTLRDPASKASLERATRSMKVAEKHLAEAADGPSLEAQKPALAAEQAAYQALLALRAREFQVIRGNPRQRGGGNSAGGPSERQLRELELSADENRFEQQSSARARQESLSRREREQGEIRRVLDRLRELARRQGDLNERLKELQSALEAATTPQARAEVERQLKRLRDQQQQVLRDTDEVKERMEREEDRDRLAQARQGLEAGREHVRQASEALEQGQLARALTEGTRAGRKLDDLREGLRKDASGRFAEELTEIRDRAKALDEGQGRLSEQLDEWDRHAGKSLRDTGGREPLRQGIERQRKQLDEVLDRMRRTVQDSEETEPLLAKGLYDTVRKAAENKVPDALKDAQRLVEVGVAGEAARSSRRAGQGLEQLRQGVEHAAEGILGDKTAALRRAQGELGELADQVDREIARATDREPNGEGPPSPPPSGRPGRSGKAGPDPRRPEGRDPARGGEPGGPQGREGEPPAQEGPPGPRDPQGGGGRGQGPLRGGNGPQGRQPAPEGGSAGERAGRPSPSPRAGGGGSGGGDPRLDRLIEGASPGAGGPIAGDGFRQWSDRMRDVEELLEDPEFRAEAARIRDRVRGAREEFKRHARTPDWGRLEGLVALPIRALRERVAEEIRRRESPDALVPIDRDPVPPRFSEGVRRYYERLGSGR